MSRARPLRPCTLGPGSSRCISQATTFFTTSEEYVGGCECHAAQAKLAPIWLGMTVRVVHDGLVKDGTVVAIGHLLAKITVRTRTGAVAVLERDIAELLASQSVPS